MNVYIYTAIIAIGAYLIGSVNFSILLSRLISGEDIRKSGEGIYLLSNISTGFAENYQNTQWINKLFSNFDGFVFSGVAELVKPNREIFEHILGKFGLVAEECLFIDDNAANIEGAKAVGIQTYLFDGDAEKLRAFLGF